MQTFLFRKEISQRLLFFPELLLCDKLMDILCHWWTNLHFSERTHSDWIVKSAKLLSMNSFVGFYGSGDFPFNQRTLLFSTCFWPSAEFGSFCHNLHDTALLDVCLIPPMHFSRIEIVKPLPIGLSAIRLDRLSKWLPLSKFSVTRFRLDLSRRNNCPFHTWVLINNITIVPKFSKGILLRNLN